jgi:hypothetical protein
MCDTDLLEIKRITASSVRWQGETVSSVAESQVQNSSNG